LGLVAHSADTLLGSSAVFVLGALQLLPPAGVLCAATLLFGELAQLPQTLPLERAYTAPGHDQGGAGVCGHGSQVNFAEVNCCLSPSRRGFCLFNLDADVQFKAVIPD